MTHVVSMRYPGFVPDAKGRLLYGSRVFEIVWAATVDEKQRETVIYCTEQTDPATP